MQATLRGIFPPIPTTFDTAGNVDTRAMAANVARWVTTGLAGVLALGSNGEATSLSEEEADRILETVREVVPKEKVLLAGTGRESTRLTIDACRRAGERGADFALVRPPSYYKGQMTTDVLIAHYRAVADASPIPVLLYNLPTTGVVLTLPVVSALAAHPNIAGMKETSTDLERLGQFAAIGNGFSVFSGSAPVVYPALVSGAIGGILAVANVLPDVCVQLYEHAKAGRHAEALSLQRRLTPLAQLVTTGYGIAGLKLALDLVGFIGGAVRAPLVTAPERARDEISRAIRAAA